MLWLSFVFIILCSCVTLLYAGAAIVAKRSRAVLSFNAPQTATQEPTVYRDSAYTFPVLIEGTTLVAESLAMYEGDMIENDSDDFVVDAAALELRNFGTREVVLAEVVLEFGDTKMVFFGTNIPAGGTALIIEREGKPWTQECYSNCSGWVQYGNCNDLTEDSLRIEDADMGTVLVTNTTNEELKDLWLYYKNYLYDAELYLGGITYVEVIPTLRPGEQVLIAPERYAKGYSKFVKAEQLG